jgi:transposase
LLPLWKEDRPALKLVHSMDRDQNAALNILHRGLQTLRL